MPLLSSVEISVEKLANDISKIVTSNFASSVELIGWIVVIDKELFLLDYKYSKDYENSTMIKISDRHIMFCIRDKILPLGGGKSFLFHKAKIKGSLAISNRQTIEILTEELFVEERGGSFIEIEIDSDSVKRSREKYEKSCVHPPDGWSGDWLDLIAPPAKPNSAKDD